MTSHVSHAAMASNLVLEERSRLGQRALPSPWNTSSKVHSLRDGHYFSISETAKSYSELRTINNV